MTVQEFIQRRNRYFKALVVPGLLEIALLYVPPLVLLVSPPRGGSFSMNLLLASLFVLVNVAVVGAGMFLWARHVEKAATDPGLQCPHCRRFLISKRSARHAITSRKCAHCDGRVLDDDT